MRRRRCPRGVRGTDRQSRGGGTHPHRAAVGIQSAAAAQNTARRHSMPDAQAQSCRFFQMGDSHVLNLKRLLQPVLLRLELDATCEEIGVNLQSSTRCRRVAPQCQAHPSSARSPSRDGSSSRPQTCARETCPALPGPSAPSQTEQARLRTRWPFFLLCNGGGREPRARVPLDADRCGCGPRVRQSGPGDNFEAISPRARLQLASSKAARYSHSGQSERVCRDLALC